MVEIFVGQQVRNRAFVFVVLKLSRSRQVKQVQVVVKESKQESSSLMNAEARRVLLQKGLGRGGRHG